MLVKRKLMSQTTFGDTHERRPVKIKAWSGTHVIRTPLPHAPPRQNDHGERRRPHKSESTIKMSGSLGTPSLSDYPM